MQLMLRSCSFDDLVDLFEWNRGLTAPAPGPELDMKFDLRASPDGRARGTHARFAQLAGHLLNVEAWGAWPVLAAVEAFADGGGLGGLRSYLKIVGSRADKLDEALQLRLPRSGEVAIEYGAFIGTTTIRLADRTTQGGHGSQRTLRVVAFEVEPVHLCFARWLVNLAGLSWAAEIWPGIGRDMAQRAADEFGQVSFFLVFFDHRGTKFHEDLAQLEQLRLLGPRSLVIADNVLRPGAPQFLWHVHSCASYETTTWAFMDNTPFPSEDWLSVAVYTRPSWHSPWPPASLERLSWDSDRWRRKSQDGGLRQSDWSAFALHAAEELARCGIEATPWFDPSTLEAEAGAVGDAEAEQDVPGTWPERGTSGEDERQAIADEGKDGNEQEAAEVAGWQLAPEESEDGGQPPSSMPQDGSWQHSSMWQCRGSWGWGAESSGTDQASQR